MATIARMRALAADYLADAQILGGTLQARSDGAYLLRLTAFEILLKALIRATGRSPGKHHRYDEHFATLPDQVQTAVLSAASGAMGPREEPRDPRALLALWSDNFANLRYSYEAYDGMTEAEVTALGEAWLAAGGRTADATFKYYPLELQELTWALQNALAERVDLLSQTSSLG